MPKAFASLMGQALLIERSPEKMLLAVDPHGDFIDVEGIALSLVLSFQAARVHRYEFYVPQPDRFSTNRNLTLSKQIFNSPVAQIESIVKPKSLPRFMGTE